MPAPISPVPYVNCEVIAAELVTVEQRAGSSGEGTLEALRCVWIWRAW
jgi:hypothetical protein